MKIIACGPRARRCLDVIILSILVGGSVFGQGSEFNRKWIYSEDIVEENPAGIQDLSVSSLTSSSSAPRWYSMFSQLPSDWSRGAGMVIKSENIPSIVGIGVVTFGLMRTDNSTWLATRRLYRSSGTFHDAAGYAVALGDGKLHLAIAGMFAGYGWLFDDSRALRTAGQTMEAFLATGLTVQVLKRVTGRESPIAATHHSGRWKFFPHPSSYQKHQASYYAFPSGHISTAMGTLTVIAENYPEERWIKPVGYTLVGALGVGLVSKGMHWYSDLPLGVAIGYLFGKLAAHPEVTPFAASAKDPGVSFVVAPGLDGQGGGRLSLAVGF
jgi:membrane-associated phospholipid phosphatase